MAKQTELEERIYWADKTSGKVIGNRPKDILHDVLLYTGAVGVAFAIKGIVDYVQANPQIYESVRNLF